jgi:cytidylate kinase
MASGKIIIAIDGYSSTGKSTFAKLVAKGLGYIYADSGALYRAVTYFAYTNGFIDDRGNIDKENLQRVLPKVEITFRTNKKGESQTFLNGANIEKYIRQSTVSTHVSPIAEIPFVRDFVNVMLRRMGQDKGLVMDGRDIGTAVFPNAEIKIFMTASEQVRAMRRFKELQAKGEKDTFESVLENLKKRDYIDSHREKDPLTKAKDAIELDNSSMSLEDEIQWLNTILVPNFNLKVELPQQEI